MLVSQDSREQVPAIPSSKKLVIDVLVGASELLQRQQTNIDDLRVLALKESLNLGRKARVLRRKVISKDHPEDSD